MRCEKKKICVRKENTCGQASVLAYACVCLEHARFKYANIRMNMHPVASHRRVVRRIASAFDIYVTSSRTLFQAAHTLRGAREKESEQ